MSKVMVLFDCNTRARDKIINGGKKNMCFFQPNAVLLTNFLFYNTDNHAIGECSSLIE